MMNYIKVGNYLIGYTKFLNDSEYTDYPWKLDAYSVNLPEGAEVDFYYKMDEKWSEEQIETKLKDYIYREYSGFFNYKIYRCDDGYIYTLRKTQGEKIVLAYHIDDEWKNWRLIFDETKTGGRYAFEHFFMLFAYAVLNYGGIVFHGSLVEYNGKGILICAPSGTGKTTHARLWRDLENALIVNGDRPLCIKDDGVWYGCGTPWCGTSGESINRRVVVKAIVVLEQYSENVVGEFDGLDGFAKVLTNTTVPMWSEDMMGKAIDMVSDILSSVIVYKLQCRPDAGAVEVLKEKIDKL